MQNRGLAFGTERLAGTATLSSLYRRRGKIRYRKERQKFGLGVPLDIEWHKKFLSNECGSISTLSGKPRAAPNGY